MKKAPRVILNNSELPGALAKVKVLPYILRYLPVNPQDRRVSSQY